MFAWEANALRNSLLDNIQSTQINCTSMIKDMIYIQDISLPNLLQDSLFHYSFHLYFLFHHQVLQKRSFLCVSDFDEDYYDFHCLPGGKAPKEGTREYSVCGTPFENRPEYIVVVSAFCLLGYSVLMQMLAYSGKQPRAYATVAPRGGAKQKRH